MNFFPFHLPFEDVLVTPVDKLIDSGFFRNLPIYIALIAFLVFIGYLIWKTLKKKK